jgi:hypothetical protein
MIRIVPIPSTPYYALWDTVTDRFITDENGDQGWEAPDEFATTDPEFMARIVRLWPDETPWKVRGIR